VRIISGELKGREVTLPKGSRARPITSFVLEQVMNLFAAYRCNLDERLPAGVFLDVCAGSGLTAFEALSRGAPRAFMVETDIEHVQALRETSTRFGVRQRTAVLKLDARKCVNAVAKTLAPGELITCVFLDPPFIPRMAADVLSHFARGLAALPEPILAANALLIIRAEDAVPDDPPGLTLLERRSTGNAKLCLFAQTGSPLAQAEQPDPEPRLDLTQPNADDADAAPGAPPEGGDGDGS
jgi:16S rRNA (guanine966-N2)-methyltransferase